MSKELVVVEAVKDNNGAYVKPDRSTETPDNIAFLPNASAPYVVHIIGYDAGDSIPDGKYYAAFYDPDTQKFLGQFIAVPGFTVAGESTPGNVQVTPTDVGGDVTLGDNSSTTTAGSATTGSTTDSTTGK
ncbi:hypothetical protein [Lentilactobacillus farraginis]|uniref:Uncharacterized protein n=1 Tax=Lentilactobacillus farraginis DSM 18382 = JCM 14108 TaxID=1423743 RepID=X0PBV0_9LACO|nr:hypothetical protein [Lentilactobacillus farraginis]KRM11256.1 hypothetical protein FD41_GL001539 [Lentilactobacillus farraginis DSM 18382 = JCM 14108]GAF37503.1 hypothetical protein JCM14108_2539 [Lentilactobacillus farraginis DSM 18382 = JCM 14108]